MALIDVVINSETGEKHIRDKKELVFDPQDIIKMEEGEYNNQKKINSLKQGIRVAAVTIENYQQNIERFYEAQPFFYDNNKLFWFWNIECDKWEIVDEIDIMNALDERFNFQGLTISNKLKSNYLEAFKRVGRKKIPKDAPIKWIQFKDKAFSINSSELYTVTPDYFFTNPIPFDIGESEETPVMNKLFEEWVGKDYVNTLYEMISYCCYRDYPIQTIFCLYGNGRNGKGQYQKIINKFFGCTGNVCSTELDTLLDSRFEAFKLYKKLVCALGETNFGVLKKTSLLKKLVGGDLIGYEKKGKDPFDDINYAKIIIASNSLPSSDDTSDGFMRRWQIINFPNEFSEGKDIIRSIPEIEYNNLAKKVTRILPLLLEKGEFTNQGTIKQRKENYILASNPITIFVKRCCIREEGGYVSYNQLYTAYVQFLKINKKRRIKMGEFKSSLEEEGFWVERTSKRLNDEFKSGRWINGLSLKENYVNYASYDLNLIPSPYVYNGMGIGLQKTQKTQKQAETEEIPQKPIEFTNNAKCFVESCQNRRTAFDSSGVPYCEDHWEKMAKLD